MFQDNNIEATETHLRQYLRDMKTWADTFPCLDLNATKMKLKCSFYERIIKTSPNVTVIYYQIIIRYACMKILSCM